MHVQYVVIHNSTLHVDLDSDSNQCINGHTLRQGLHNDACYKYARYTVTDE